MVFIVDGSVFPVLQSGTVEGPCFMCFIRHNVRFLLYIALIVPSHRRSVAVRSFDRRGGMERNAILA